MTKIGIVCGKMMFWNTLEENSTKNRKALKEEQRAFNKKFSMVEITLLVKILTMEGWLLPIYQ